MGDRNVGLETQSAEGNGKVMTGTVQSSGAEGFLQLVAGIDLAKCYG
jgi:hypothetical protein